MTRDPWFEVRSDPRLLPAPEPVDLDALTASAAFTGEDGWQLAELFGLVVTVVPRGDFL